MMHLRPLHNVELPDATPTRDLHRRIDDEIIKTRTVVKDIERALESTPGAGTNGGGKIFGSPAWFQSLDPDWEGLDTFHHHSRWDAMLMTPERQVVRKKCKPRCASPSPSPPSTRPNHLSEWDNSTVARPSSKHLITKDSSDRKYSPMYGSPRLKSNVFFDKYNMASYTRDNEMTRLKHRTKAREGNPVTMRQHIQDRLHEKYQIPKYTTEVMEEPPSPSALQMQQRTAPVPPFDPRNCERDFYTPRSTKSALRAPSRRRPQHVTDPKDLSTQYFRELAKAEPDDTVRPTITKTGLYAR